MNLKFGVLMDPIKTIEIYKDTTFAILLALQVRGHEIYYLEPADIFLKNEKVFGSVRRMRVEDNSSHWFDADEREIRLLHTLDILLMRKDPPFNMSYIYLTYLLELAEKEGLLVVNKPASLRDANEKLFTSRFPQCTPKTLITSRKKILQQFIHEQKTIIIKPLDAMAGESIFYLTANDPNVPVIIEMMTVYDRQLVMAQQFIPEVKFGDKRIILINGEPIPYALARIPSKDDFRGNLARGAKGEGRELTVRDRWICKQVGPTLREKGLWFVGLDVIGDYLTEINVTSPTGIRELQAQFDIDIAGQLINFIEKLFSRLHPLPPPTLKWLCRAKQSD